MRKLLVLGTCLAIAMSLVLTACSSDKNSVEACLYQTTLDLDKGNYDAVLASTCADSMQVGAAWFGKAGYDITNVLNRFVDANDDSGTSEKSDLNIYMNSLVSGAVTGTTLSYLDSAKTAYSNVLSVENGYKDSLFYIGLVDTMKGLSVMKLVIQDPTGSIDSTCDLNGNGKADDVDATACALKLSFNQSCDATLSVTTIPGLTITGSDGATFAGFQALNITTNAALGTASCGNYTKIQYPDLSSPSGFSLATTTLGKCAGSDSNLFDPNGLWPCPIDNPDYLDFVTAIDSSLSTAISSISDSIFTEDGEDTDVQASINEIKSGNCCTDPGEFWNANDPNSCACSSSEIADYLLTI